MTGNECRNWKASTLKRHAHSADHKQSVVAKAMPWSFQFQMSLMRKERVMQPYFVPKLTNVWSSTNDIHHFIDNKWLLNSLHHLKNSRVFYNDITKKTCMISDARSKPLHFPA